MTVPQAFELALQHHRAGRLAEAETVYRQILALQPNHAGAHHLLGVICHQAGRNDLAIDLIRQAISLNPNNPSAHSNLGEAYRALGRFDEAIASYRSALQLQPDHPDAHYNLGNALQGQGRPHEAITAYHRALQFRPDYTEAHINLGAVLVGLNQYDEAIAAYRQALRLKPDLAETYNNLGTALMHQGRFEEAADAIRRALELNPDYAEAHHNLGAIFAEQRCLDEAVAAYRRALECKPDYAEALSNLGNALREQGQFDEALVACRQALKLQPDHLEAQNNLGSALLELGQLDEAIIACRRALALKPDSANAKFNYSILLLLRGDFEQGWPCYEARWNVTKSAKQDFSQPMWDGGPVQDRRLLIHAEQGFGDAIHFVRYAPLIAARGGEVVVECPPPLVALFRSAKGVREVVAAGDPLPPFDQHLPMLSLPLVFQTTRESIPKDIPYLFADPDRGGIWKERLGRDRSRLRVGLTWTGNPQNRRTRIRDVSFEMLLPILRIEGIEFFSLQVDQGANMLRPSTNTSGIIDHTGHIQDFADTAALMAQLDLIITVDTAPAHLAGALGFPVWALLPFVPDWRWGLKGDDTPWYPTMRLFRQPSLGDWASVIRRVVAELEQNESS